METEFIPRRIINGSMLSRSTGQTISIIVKPTDVDNSGKMFKAVTTDDFNVRIVLSSPLNVAIEDWIEVIGIVTSVESIKCSEIILFDKDPEQKKPFSNKNHNMMVNFLANCSNFLSNE